MNIPNYTENLDPREGMKEKRSKDDFARIETIFVWIDILGFSKKLENENDYDAMDRLLYCFRDHFVDGNGKYEVTSISDGMICELNPKRDSWTINDVFSCMDMIAQKQADFITKYGYLVRGGISVGTKLDSGQSAGFIGNGLSRAYNTESNHISWPVIGFVLNKRMKKFFYSFYHIRNIKKYLKLNCTKNEQNEDVYFIDYKSKITNKMDAIKDLVSTELKKEDNPLRVKMKYEWVKQYFGFDLEEKAFLVK